METTWEIARKVDADTLLALMRQYYEFDGIPFDERVQRPSLEKLLKDESLGRVYLVRAVREAVGYVVLTFDYSLEFGGREIFIDELYVAQGHRGRGVGTRTLEFVEKACRSLGVKAIHLAVQRENAKAQSVYVKFGFGVPERYLMTKVLRP